MCQVMQNGVVFNFTKSNQIRYALVRCRQQFLSDIIQFSPITFLCPMTGRLRQVLGIILAFIVVIIEEILAIEFNECQRLR